MEAFVCELNKDKMQPHLNEEGLTKQLNRCLSSHKGVTIFFLYSLHHLVKLCSINLT
jgi:hypothetical protein